MDTILENSSADQKSGRKTTVIAIIAAILFTGLVLAGFLFMNKRHRDEEIRRELSANPPAVPVPSPQLVLVQDEARLKGSNAQVNGTVQNISDHSLTGLNVELELTRRSDGGIEKKQVPLSLAKLSPSEKGSYSFTVSRDFKAIKVARIVESSGAEVPFRAEAGSKRPPEGPPATKTVVVNRSFHGKGEEFINTADTPSRLP